MSGYGHEGDHCGEGTSWGCGFIVETPGRLLLNARPALTTRSGRDMSRHVLFHVACWPKVATVPAYSKGLAAELGAVEA